VIELPKIPKPPGADQGPRWFQIAVALSMVLSAGAALVSAFRTSATMSALVEQNAKLVRAGSTPILQWQNSNSNLKGDAELSYTLENAGTGPARVVWLELSYKGKKLDSARGLLAEGVKELGIEQPRSTSTMTGSIAGSVLVAGRVQQVFRWARPSEAEAGAFRLWKAVERMPEHFDIQACYCSVFDDCWLTKFDGKVPQPVAACQAEGKVNLNGG
jgi:hypothetical protein